MNCPKCQTPRLKPTKLAAGLPAEGCQECHGALVALLTYRDWQERHPLAAKFTEATKQTAEIDDNDTKTALNCPKCGGIMTKYRFSAQSQQRLDLCVRCNEVWLDDGEWKLIQALSLTEQFTRFFNDRWQLQIKQEHHAALQEDKFKTLFGKDYEEIKRLRDWLAGHAQRREILDYLNREAGL
ncbi:TFIIB-type zinc ribbon-containing protein [Methylomarinum vadi]|uniref:TFIIB-type zinc ribbon-containing protein n=1 Tax=Methylomarinum vadi TaxID=438855 RepID=UPI0004DF35F8|nr:zf-TFIIB domain-containing protein [Methylomarinum vadi]